MFDSSLRDLGSLFPVFLLFFMAGLLLRWAGIQENVLFADDFLYFVDHSSTLIDLKMCQFPAQDYRWLSIGQICLTATYFSSFALSAAPKFLGVLFLALFALGLFICFRSWGVGRVEAILAPLVVVAHPIVNQVILWNITGRFFLNLSLPLFAYLLFTCVRSRWSNFIALLLMLLVVFTYEYALVVFLLLVVAQPFITSLTTERTNLRRSAVLLSIFVAFSCLYLLQVKVSAYLFPANYEFERGVAGFDDLATMMLAKFWHSLNLIVNVYMTPLSYFVPLERSWGLWKWLPIVIGTGTLIAVYFDKRSWRAALLYAAFSGAIVFTAVLPLFASTQSPESWRVSIPALIGFVIGLLPIMTTTNVKAVSRSLLTLVIVVLAVVARAESHLRVVERNLENELLTTIKIFWAEQGVPESGYQVGRLETGSFKTDSTPEPAQNLSVAYHRRGLQLNIALDFAWRGRLLFEGFRTIELDSKPSSIMKKHGQSCFNKPGACNFEIGSVLKNACREQPDYIQAATQIRLTHDLDNRITAICI